MEATPITPKSAGPKSAGRRRPVRPVLLLLVVAAFLMIVGATASGQAALVTADSTSTLLKATVSADAAAVRSFVGLNLRQSDLPPAALTADRAAVLQHGLQLLVEHGGILHAALLAPDGTIVAADADTTTDHRAALTPEISDVVAKQAAGAAIVGPDAAGALAPLATGSILREYLPIIQLGQVDAVVAIWRDAAPILAELDAGRVHVVVITLTAALISTLLLIFIFWAAQQRLSRQTRLLVEAARRDPLTGALNHGALVELLAASVERARLTHEQIGVALLDLDNFGLLNSTYGHQAGDFVLDEVTRLLKADVPATMTWGRYGPDEFLVVGPPGAESDLEPLLERIRSHLAELSLEFDGSERLPVTLSAGLCAYPANGESVTTLLSVAAVTLNEARAGGGDTVLPAEAGPPAAPYAKTFDILEGLVIAVDTKDRYTRRHSEDVARYADFLARELGLDPETRQAIHRAGLLHDIGKIGIPDVILRKPGRLTDEEMAIVKQHVALGDAIVRDLPDIDLIRAGIRHHHERWDGQGYLARLAGEEIPLVGRILAVGDAFSAMTTTRPYRKALSVEEALRRLEDASGSQLEARLVKIFVRGIWTVADPPLPGQDRITAVGPSLVIPGGKVA
jgi:diguanylate cyclase (GGDEF)-like protein/putative nucleotidyltransferase with HDIG domain